ncbi:MAG TPA: universal stress protein [Longimicrobiales bacterium]
MQRIKSILAATDLSEPSDHSVRAAAALAELTGAAWHILHAFEFESAQYPMQSGQPLTFQEQIAAANTALDEQLTRVFRGKTNPASREVMIYIAFKAIRAHAETVKADLIVLARHRPRPLGDAFLGSTVDRVIRSVDVPCLIVPGPMTLPLRRILAPIDLSKPAMGALEIALNWGASLGAAEQPPRIDILHVIPRVFNFADVPLDAGSIQTQLAETVATASAHAGVDAGVTIQQELKWADSPADEILNFAEESRADLIVMGTHGYGAFKRALIGSVAGAVARAANRPVLLVPPSLWKNEPDSE